MSNSINEINNNSFFSDSGAQRDESIPLDSLIKAKKENTPQQTEKKKELSPLEQMKVSKENNNSGMEISNEALKEKELRNPIMDDQRLSEFEERELELDESINKRKAIVVIKEPTNSFEYMNLMMELDSVVLHDDGTATIEYKDKHGNPMTPQYIRLREDGDEAFDLGKDKKAMAERAKMKDVSAPPENNDSGAIAGDAPDDELNKTVQVLIDKTGLGTDFIFNDEEKKKLTEAPEIQIREIEFVDIESIISKKSEKSFQESISAYQLSNSKTTICFPASGFRAQMKGLTYGEMGDISLSMDSVTFDQYRKRLSIIYNKMVNSNIGPFKSFEDFLKGFAYVDIPMALYGLYISTQSEIQTIQLRCGNEECGKSFNWEFSTRSVIRLEKCSKQFLEKMKEIATSPASEYDKIREKSAVMNSKYVKLPYSGFIVEMGIISAYEFLYNFIPVLDEKTFKDAFGEDLNEIYMNNVLLLTTVKSVRVPNDDGTYSVAEGYKDILDAIYRINPEEIKLLAAITNKLTTEYQSYFSFGDVTCPHCGNVTHDLDLTMDDLVFQTYQRLLSTEINVQNMQSFSM